MQCLLVLYRVLFLCSHLPFLSNGMGHQESNLQTPARWKVLLHLYSLQQLQKP